MCNRNQPKPKLYEAMTKIKQSLQIINLLELKRTTMPTWKLLNMKPNQINHKPMQPNN